MAEIRFKLNGSYNPFIAELRSNSPIGTIVQNIVVQEKNTDYFFSGVTSGTYYLVAYDRIGGIVSSSELNVV
jgi:ABC-type transport system substrate-binding protein